MIEVPIDHERKHLIKAKGMAVDGNYESLEEALAHLDALKEPLDELRVESLIRPLLGAQDTAPDQRVLAECMAFSFTEDYGHQGSGWGTYYGPQMVLSDAEGSTTESPSLSLITQETLMYWDGRARTSTNPFLRSRYADLVWDFSKRVTGKGASIDLARIAVDSTLEAVASGLVESARSSITKLSRAMSIALSINDTDRIEQVKTAVIAHEDKIAEDSKRGLWGFSFDILLLNKNKVALTKKEEHKIVQDLEARAARLATPSSQGMPDAQGVEQAAMRLASYYQKRNQNDDVKRVLRLYGDAYVSCSRTAAALVGSMWLKKVYDVYRSYGMTEDADRIDALLRELGVQSVHEMKTFKHSREIPQKEMDAFLEAMTAGTTQEAIQRITARFLPRGAEVKAQLQDLAEHAPLQFLFTRAIVDHEGTTVATIGSLQDDPDGNLVHRMQENLQINAVFLRSVIEKFQEKEKDLEAKLCEFITGSPVFTEERHEVIKSGVHALFQGDHVTAAHLIVPQIEAALRQLGRMAQRPLYRPGRHGGLHLRNFDDLIRDEVIRAALGEDIIKYMCVVLTDQRGWNLRNQICHGLTLPHTLGTTTSSRLLHILLVLGHVHENKEDPGGE